LTSGALIHAPLHQGLSFTINNTILDSGNNAVNGQSAGSLTLNNKNITGVTSATSGATAIFSLGAVTLNSSTISGTACTFGGTVDLTTSQVVGTSSPGNTSGIITVKGGKTTLTDSSVLDTSGNTMNGIIGTGHVELNRSTIARATGAVDTTAIVMLDGETLLVNSTLSNNTGGIATFSGDVTLVYSDVVSNGRQRHRSRQIFITGDLNTFGSVLALATGAGVANCEITGTTNSSGHNSRTATAVTVLRALRSPQTNAASRDRSSPDATSDRWKSLPSPRCPPVLDPGRGPVPGQRARSARSQQPRGSPDSEPCRRVGRSADPVDAERKPSTRALIPRMEWSEPASGCTGVAMTKAEEPTTTADDRSDVKCRNCGAPVDPRRVELGYDYCTGAECQERFVRGVELARVTVNKAADQYVRAEDVVPRGPRPRWGIDEEDDGAGLTRRRAPKPPRVRRLTSEKKLQRASEKLDAALMGVYERFCRSEITHAKMRSEQNALIRAYNDLVRSENIRYRSFLRKRV
jgi:hypothetical protein